MHRQNATVKFLSVLMSLFLSLFFFSGLLPSFVAAASIDTAYVDENRSSKIVAATFIDSATTNLTTGWYVVQGNVTTSNLTVSGNVKIILADGCRWVAGATGDRAAIAVHSPSTLTIYGQTLETGVLDATGSGHGAGIGGTGGADGSTAGAGQAGQPGANGGSFTLVGGNVTTNRLGGGSGGRGVHSITAYANGGTGGNSGTIAVEGGSLTVTGAVGGGDGGASNNLRGGKGGDLTSLTISGGKVKVGRIGGGQGGDGDFEYKPMDGKPIAAIGIAGDGGTNGWQTHCCDRYRR